MSALCRSLLYDAVFVLLAGAVALSTSGSVQEWAVFLLVCCALKAPYDAWQGWKTDRADRTRPRSTRHSPGR